MNLVLIATSPCGQGSCPTIYLDQDTGAVVVQGYATAPVETADQNGEAVTQVVVPASVLLAARDQLKR
jgi:hypothetical protein